MHQSVEFNLDLEKSTLNQAYTIVQSTVAKGVFIRQATGPNHYGCVEFVIEPHQGRTHFLLEWCVTEEQIPIDYLPAVIEGIKEAACEGLEEHKPIVNIRVQVIDGSYHCIDSKLSSYRIAAKQAFQAALQKLGIVSLAMQSTQTGNSISKISSTQIEPIVNLPITSIEEISLQRIEKSEQIDYFNVAVGYDNTIVLTESTYYPTTVYSQGREVEEFLVIKQEHKPQLLSALQESLKVIGMNVSVQDLSTDSEEINFAILASFKALSDRGKLPSLYAVESWLNQQGIAFEKSNWFSF